jgi:hypothetical protein
VTRPLVFAVALVLVACGDTGESNVVADPGPTSTAEVTAPRPEPESSDTTAAPDPALEARPIVDPETLGEPPTVRVAGDEDVLELRPWTTCWRSYCADGAPPRDPEEISAQRAVIVEFPVADWQFSATATDRSTECGRNQTVELDPIGPTVFRLDPMGPPGDYTITLTGRGPGGDLFVSFRWQTTTEGVLPTPEASISVLADHDGTVDSYGVEATITVRWDARLSVGVGVSDLRLSLARRPLAQIRVTTPEELPAGVGFGPK